MIEHFIVDNKNGTAVILRDPDGRQVRRHILPNRAGEFRVDMVDGVPIASLQVHYKDLGWTIESAGEVD